MSFTLTLMFWSLTIFIFAAHVPIKDNLACNQHDLSCLILTYVYCLPNVPLGLFTWYCWSLPTSTFLLFLRWKQTYLCLNLSLTCA